MGYGPSLDFVSRILGRQLVKLLRGMAPSDIPIEQPTKFELAMPAHHLLEHFLDAYLTALRADVGGEFDKGSPLFRTLGGRGRKQLTPARMARQDARRMIVRRAVAAGIITSIGCHTFRATGITVYLLNGGLLEYAQQMAAHESARTTKLYDRCNDQVTLDQVERIVL
jgi:integrase